MVPAEIERLIVGEILTPLPSAANPSPQIVSRGDIIQWKSHPSVHLSVTKSNSMTPYVSEMSIISHLITSS